MNTDYRPGSRAAALADDSDEPMGGSQDLTMQSEVGALEQSDVDQAIEQHWHALQGCYDRAGSAQRYVGGQVLLRFLVSAAGQVDDVLVVKNEIGNYAVERCLVVEGRRMQFPPPRGGGATEFEYGIRFKSTGEISVVDWLPTFLHDEVGALAMPLSSCPPLGPDPVTAVVYIEPNGGVGSAGLLSAGPIDPEAGTCALDHVRKWKLSGDKGHVIRTSFQLRAANTAGASGRAYDHDHPRVAKKVHAKSRR